MEAKQVSLCMESPTQCTAIATPQSSKFMGDSVAMMRGSQGRMVFSLVSLRVTKSCTMAASSFPMSWHKLAMFPFVLPCQLNNTYLAPKLWERLTGLNTMKFEGCFCYRMLHRKFTASSAEKKPKRLDNHKLPAYREEDVSFTTMIQISIANSASGKPRAADNSLRGMCRTGEIMQTFSLAIAGTPRLLFS